MTKINIIEGFDSACPVPKMVRAAGLNYRVAVIQDTYRADKVDMYFDLSLWEHILEFASKFGENVSIVQLNGESEVKPDTVIEALREMEEVDQEPPEFILLRHGQELVLCIATEYWAHIGGPMPYHDSYTYSLFSKHNITENVRTFLTEAAASQDWEIHY